MNSKPGPVDNEDIGTGASNRYQTSHRPIQLLFSTNIGRLLINIPGIATLKNMGFNEDNKDDALLPSPVIGDNGILEKKNSKGIHSGSHNSDEMFKYFDTIRHDPKALKREKRKILKNLILISFAFLCNFIGFGGTSSLQSSLNYEDGLGVASLSILYAALILSAMFLPTIVINRLGCKRTIVASIIGYLTYTLANFYAHWATLVPSSIIVGIAGAPLWAAKCAYLTTSAKRYAYLTKETTDCVLNRFFGIFFLFFQLNNIIGQLISSFVLSSGNASDLAFPSCYNATYIENHCGANDCQTDFNKTRRLYSTEDCPVNDLQSGKPPPELIYALMGIYCVIALVGAGAVAFFVDPIKIRNKETRGPFDLLIATFKHMKDYRQILLIVITMYSGFEQAFLFGDITKSFITCPLAVNWVGFVLICFGTCDATFSFIFGKCEKYTGRPILFSLAFAINLTLVFVFLFWIPYPSSPVLFFLLPALWGVADAVWQTQLNAFYGVLFVTNQEASFANYRLWESLGFVIAFAYQNFICVRIKLIILLCVLAVGMALYYYVEIDRRRQLRHTKATPCQEKGGKHEEDNNAYLQSNNSMNKKNGTIAMQIQK